MIFVSIVCVSFLNEVCQKCVENVKNRKKFNEIPNFLGIAANICNQSQITKSYPCVNLSAKLIEISYTIYNEYDPYSICQLFDKCPYDGQNFTSKFLPKCHTCINIVAAMTQKRQIGDQNSINSQFYHELQGHMPRILLLKRRLHGPLSICQDIRFCPRQTLHPQFLDTNSKEQLSKCNICRGLMNHLMTNGRNTTALSVVSSAWDELCSSVLRMDEYNCQIPKSNNNFLLFRFLEYLDTKYTDSTLCYASDLCP